MPEDEQTTGWNFPEDLPKAAWGIIANAGEGNWERESEEWREAAARWRDAYHETLLGGPSPTDLALSEVERRGPDVGE